MNRADLQRRVREIDAQVLRLEENIAFQVQMLAKLDEGGHDVRAAGMFLTRLESWLKQAVAERDRLFKALAKASSQCRRQVADCRYYMHLEKAHVASRCAAGATGCPYRKRCPSWREGRDQVGWGAMIAFLILVLHVLVSPFKTQARLEAEIIMLRHQLNVLRRKVPKPKLVPSDRLLFVWLCRLFPAALNAVAIVQPETIMRWHRAGFRLYWRWKSRSRGGRPKVPTEIRRLIREMSLANPLWGAPRIHGELLKLGIEVAHSTVAKYMAKSGRGGSQTWKTFLHNHSAGVGAMDS
jgi:hypothetical protein